MTDGFGQKIHLQLFLSVVEAVSQSERVQTAAGQDANAALRVWSRAFGDGDDMVLIDDGRSKAR